MNGPNGLPFFMMPFGYQNDTPKTRQQPFDQVPMRVRVAGGILQDLYDVMMPTAVPHGMGVEEIEGRVLDVEERELFSTAVKTLTKYLTGSLALTPAEQEDRELYKDDRKKGEKTLLRCPQCGGSRQVMGRKCSLCQGQGGLMVEPATPDGG